MIIFTNHRRKFLYVNTCYCRVSKAVAISPTQVSPTALRFLTTKQKEQKMSYKNAAQILPPELLREVQKYIDGDFLYVPRVTNHRREWGATTTAKQELQERNLQIYSEYLSGERTERLAERYFLSKKSIERIISQCRKKN